MEKEKEKKIVSTSQREVVKLKLYLTMQEWHNPQQTVGKTAIRLEISTNSAVRRMTSRPILEVNGSNPDWDNNTFLSCHDLPSRLFPFSILQ